MVGLYDALAGRRGPLGQVGVIGGHWPNRALHDLAGQDRAADLEMNTRHRFRSVAGRDRAALLDMNIRRRRSSVADNATVRDRAALLDMNMRRTLGCGGK